RRSSDLDCHDPAIRHKDQIAGCAEVVDTAEEAPGLAVIVGMKHLTPHDAGRIALAAGDAQDAPARQQISARIEPTMADESDAGSVIGTIGIAERILSWSYERHEMEFTPFVDATVDYRVAMRVVVVDREQEHQQAAVWSDQGGLYSCGRGEVIKRDQDGLAPGEAAIARKPRGGLSVRRSKTAICTARDEHIRIKIVDRSGETCRHCLAGHAAPVAARPRHHVILRIVAVPC